MRRMILPDICMSAWNDPGQIPPQSSLKKRDNLSSIFSLPAEVVNQHPFADAHFVWQFAVVFSSEGNDRCSFLEHVENKE